MQVCDRKSAVSEHTKGTGHSTDWASVKIISQENHFLSRKIREALHIHLRGPTMSHDHGYHLPPPPPNLWYNHHWISNPAVEFESFVNKEFLDFTNVTRRPCWWSIQYIFFWQNQRRGREADYCSWPPTWPPWRHMQSSNCWWGRIKWNLFIY